MLLHCGIDAPHAAGDMRQGTSWLRPETLETLAELNELGLALLLQEATLQGAQHGMAAAPLLREVGTLRAGLEPPALRRAAACPYLLFDVGFAAAARWRPAAPGQVGDAAASVCGAFFTAPATVEVARLVLTFGWHLARTQVTAARLLLGMPSACAGLIGALTLRRVHALAERHPEWLRPRWHGRPQVWRALLSAAAAGEARALEQAQIHGLTLLAAEVRAAARLTSPAGTASTAPSPRSPARP
jgi:hypothetical protein